jgi:hypothetical protein
MSQRLLDNTHFLSLLFATDKKQQRALLSNITNSQVDLISEIFYNLDSVLPLTSYEEKTLKRKQFIPKLAKITTAVARRRRLISQHKNQILKILQFFAPKLLQLIQTRQ